MNKTYCFTDIHGNYTLWKQIRDFCDETDTLYFLGDAADRGEDGMHIIHELLKDKRVIYLKGNHEDIFVDVGSELAEGISWSKSLWTQNGGKSTIKSFKRLSYDSQVYYIKRLAQLPIKAEYINTKGQKILLSHAGFTPGEAVTVNDLIWDRNHIHHKWPTTAEYENVYIIHGHSPTPLLFRKGAPVFYCNNHKIDLDAGTFASGKIVLFDLDEMEVAKIFYDNEIVQKVLGE